MTTTEQLLVPFGWQPPSGYPLLCDGDDPIPLRRELVGLLGDHASALYLQHTHTLTAQGPYLGGYRWAVRSATEWCNGLMLTAGNVRRIVQQLTDIGLLRSTQPAGYNRTAWRRIDYGTLAAISGRVAVLQEVRRSVWSVIERVAALTALLERDGPDCHYCGDVGTDIDHVVARASGGSDELENLVIACRPCNSRKGDRSYEWMMNRMAAIGEGK